VNSIIKKELIMKNIIKIIPCFIFMSFACADYSQVEESSVALKSKDRCETRAYETALKLNAGMDATFPFLVPATANQGAAAFASFFADDGVFQSPGGILRGKTAVFEGFRDYAQNPGEMNQHVIIRKTYWDPKTATLVVERTWFATLTVATNFCGTMLNPGDTYSQDDCVVIRFACDEKCKKDCVLPGKVVYYNEYFNPGQTTSNFTSVYPAPCDSLKN
jgi:hypothetical protein